MLELASARFNVPQSSLSIADGAISLTSDSSQRVTYGDLIGALEYFVADAAGNRAGAFPVLAAGLMNEAQAATNRSRAVGRDGGGQFGTHANG